MEKFLNVIIKVRFQGQPMCGGIMGCVSVSSTKDVIIEYCYNTKNISGTSNVGGILGYGGIYPKVYNCYNYGNITSSGSVTNGTKYSIAGGIVANSRSNGLVIYCYNTGAITHTSNGIYTGGIVGTNQAYNGSSNESSRESIVQYSYNTGNVISNGNRVGGIVGHNSSYCYTRNCFNLDTAIVQSNSNTATTPIGKTPNFLGEIAGYATSQYIENSGTLSKADLPSVYYVVNGLSNNSGGVWLEDKLKEGSETEYKYNNNGYPILAWELN